MNAIEVRGLGKTYPGGVEAVKGIDFDVAPGEVFGLLGPNGAGKSTTIGMLTTTIRPTSGTASLAGYDVVRQPIDARRVSSVVFQEPVVDQALSGRRNLDLHARLWGIDPRAQRHHVADLIEAHLFSANRATLQALRDDLAWMWDDRLADLKRLAEAEAKTAKTAKTAKRRAR